MYIHTCTTYIYIDTHIDEQIHTVYIYIYTQYLCIDMNVYIYILILLYANVYGQLNIDAK